MECKITHFSGNYPHILKLVRHGTWWHVACAGPAGHHHELFQLFLRTTQEGGHCYFHFTAENLDSGRRHSTPWVVRLRQSWAPAHTWLPPQPLISHSALALHRHRTAPVRATLNWWALGRCLPSHNCNFSRAFSETVRDKKSQSTPQYFQEHSASLLHFDSSRYPGVYLKITY